MNRTIPPLLFAVFALALASIGFAQPYPSIRTQLVAYPVKTLDGKGLTATGKLQIPKNVNAKMPAVLILHGSAGLDSRGQMHALDLNRAGVVTLELDLWGPRGLTGGPGSRSPSPFENLPDVYGAFDLLAKLPEVDPARIGVTGFSWGGVLSLLTASQKATRQYLGEGRRFAAHLAFYPGVCWGINRAPGMELAGLTGAPVRVLIGAADRYEADPESCPKMLTTFPPEDRAVMSVKVYPGAEHGFNMQEAPYTYTGDPYLNRGRGGEGRSAPEPDARLDARKEMVRFFLGMAAQAVAR